MATHAPAKAAPKKAPAKPAGKKKAVQPKMSVGAANDRFEHEADRIANRMGKPDSTSAPPPTISALGTVQRQALPAKPGPEKRKNETAKPPEQRTQRKAANKPGGGKPVTPAVTELAKPPEKRSQRKAAPGAKAAPKPAAKGGGKGKKGQRKAVPAAKAPAKPRAKAAPAAAASKGKAAHGQRKETNESETVGLHGGDVPQHVERKIDGLRSRQAPGIDPALRSRVEQAVGSDLSGARVHKDAQAADAASALGARAFTVGHDMFFGRGEYQPQTSSGQRLIAHEAAHTVQQNGGSSQARRVVRMKPKKDGKKAKKKAPAAPKNEVEELSGKDWKVSSASDFKGAKGTLTVPVLELPYVVTKLKGAANDALGPKADSKNELPVEKTTFKRNPQTSREQREDGAAYEKWSKYIAEHPDNKIGEKLREQLKDQQKLGPLKAPAPLAKKGADKDVYVLKRKSVKGEKLDTVIVGTPEELAKNDNLTRPMINKAGRGGIAQLDADHILEDQLGGADSAENMWLLDHSVNRSYGSQIKARIDASLKVAIDGAAELNEENEEKDIYFKGKLPDDIETVKQKWVIVFEKVLHGTFDAGDNPKTHWTRADVLGGAHVQYFTALTEAELIEQGFRFDKDEKPKRINVFPARDGGRAASLEVSGDGKSLKPPTGYWFRGLEILSIPKYNPKALEGGGDPLVELNIRYAKKDKKGGKWENKNLIAAEGPVKVMHDPRLGFGGYMSRESIRAAFKGAKFGPLSPIEFPDMGISPEGDLVGTGSVLSSKELLPGLQVPISLMGTDIFMSFPVPGAGMSLGPVKVTDAALNMGVGDNGFFIAGVAGIAVDQVGSGSLFARVEKDDVLLGGNFNLDMDFLNPASITATYSLAKDDFDAKLELGVGKDVLPGVESGSVTVELSRKAVNITGSLNLGGILKGSTITVEYKPETGVILEAKDIPLPVAKLPGVSEASLSVKAQRDPVKGEWSVSGGGKAKFGVAGAKGELDILYDGIGVTFAGRADVAKGPASGWLEIHGTNHAIDDKGNPIENGPVGDLKIWGKGEASVMFGKVLKGTAGLDYTPDGRVIVAGEIAMPPTYDLFPKKDLSPKDPLLNIEPPAFPIWGVTLGPVDIGILAFVKASLRAEAWVGPGQLKDAKIRATMDLDKPEEAVVDGGATFFVPSYAGFDLYLGGGLKASAAVAYVRGDVGLYGKLGLGVDGSFGVQVHWSKADGLAVGADAKLEARPKFEVGLRASVTAGVTLPWPLPDIDHTWGPWEEKLGEFGPDMALTASFPMKWSENDGLDLDPGKIKIDPPNLNAKELLKNGFDTLV